MMKRYGLRAILSFVLLAVGALNTEAGSGGVSIRGGSGVVCGYDTHPTVLEDYLLNSPENVQFDLRAMVDAIRVRDSRLALLVQTLWNSIGPTETWPSPIPKAREQKQPGILLDDFIQDFTLPDDCEILQLAVMNRVASTPRPILLPAGRRLDQRGRNFLRLHETLYAIGDIYYGHRSSFLTRQLVLALFHRKDLPHELDSAVSEFVTSKADLTEIVLRKPELEGLLVRSQAYFTTDFRARKTRFAVVSFIGRDHLLECTSDTLRSLRNLEGCSVYYTDYWEVPENMVPMAPPPETEERFRNADYFGWKAYWRF
ncbi:MAG: hypothetical protein JST04_10610 [Bdellovibrionales bacterium]|nr:hypothetical protein [Bdellovibrionales bacterium]